MEEFNGCSSLRLPRDCLLDYANPDMNNKVGNFSIQLDNAIDDTPRLLDNQQSNPTQTDTALTKKTKTKSWWKEEQVDFFKCYSKAINLGLTSTKCTYNICR